MKVVSVLGERQSALVEKRDPQPKGEFVVVRIDVSPTCTEYKGWLKGWKDDRLGHEAAGTVVAVDGSRKVKEGDRVVVMPQFPCGRCRLCLEGEYVYCQNSLDALEATGNESGTGTYAQMMIKQDWMLLPIPDDISTEHASMANCALGPAWGGARRIGISGEDTVLVTGLGPVGLGAVMVAKWMGAKVIATETSPYRMALARELGADHVLDASDPEVLSQIMSLTDGIGVDKVLECAGAPPAHRLAIDALRRLGSLSFVGEAGDLTVAVSNDLLRKGITLHGSWYYNLADTKPLMKMIRQSGPSLDRLITHKFPMSQVEEAWQLQEKSACGKVLLYPWEN